MLKLHQLCEKSGAVTWGLPHKKGVISEKDSFYLKYRDTDITTDTKALAYWDDGSVKWSLHSAVLPETSGSLELMSGNAESNVKLNVVQTAESIIVNTGLIIAELGIQGNEIIKNISSNGLIRCKGGRLVAINEQRFETEGYQTSGFEKFTGEISEAVIEECGSVRAVIHYKGTHVCKNNRNRHKEPRTFLPFDLRLYFYAGTDEIKIAHTFFFNGQPQTDFIHGLGLTFDCVIEGKLYNRHVRFAGERGIYCDSPKGMLTWRTTGKYKEMYKKQNRCEMLEFDKKEDETFLGLLDESAVWNDFKITQLSSEEYNVEKRVGKDLVYIKGHCGHKAIGAGGISDKNGGMFIHMDKFSEKYPSAIHCENLASDSPSITAWLWSPDSPSMDLRHYDTRCHVYSAYEGFDELRATPYGIANTNELTLKITSNTLSNEALFNWGVSCGLPSLLVPDDLNFYREAGVLGQWSLPDCSTDEKASIEQQLEDLFSYYKKEVESRRWYGFWNYGDVMHTYDDVHHCWKYDMGGQAWQNTELVPNLWLWYSFLRTGRADYFEFAKAMTRHTSEVDMYHFGEYAGLGSRHNVVHWGCGCKEARISMAGLHKIFAYLTGDERVLDILDEVADSDYIVGKLDPMRSYYPPNSKFDTHVRFGPDVMAFCSNWFTYWERHRDERYLEKINKTLAFFKQKHRFILSSVYGYDPKTTTYYDFVVQGGSHFMHCFGNLFVWLEIANAFDDKEIMERLYDLGQCYGQNDADTQFRRKLCADFGYPEIADKAPFKHASYNVAISIMSASKRGNNELKNEIKHQLFNDEWVPLPIVNRLQLVDTYDYHKIIEEVPCMNTNGVAQWATNAIIALEYI